jgi:dihydropyrimidinase
MDLLIKNGTLITDTETRNADLLIQDGKIADIGLDLLYPAVRILDVKGMLVIPGGVDVHTHFDLPMFGTVSSDDHYTGHKAAAFGGTTTVIDFVPQEGGSMEENVSAWRDKADAKAAIDFGFHMNLSRWDDRAKADLRILSSLGITSIKVFMAYNNRLRLGDSEIFQVMRLAQEYGLLTMLHAENGDVIELLTREALQAGHFETVWHAKTRPAWGAVETALRGISLAAQTGAPLYIVHMNVGGEVDMLSYARQQDLPVMGETCPQYLFFTSDDLARPDGAKWVCSPPLRSISDQPRLWEGLQNGTIQVLGTDHCPFFYDGRKSIEYEGKEIAIPGKELGAQVFTKIPNGLPGVGDRLPVMWTHGVVSGKLSPNQFVALVSTNPAKIFGLYPRKGTLLVGSDADLVIWDPQRRVKYGVELAQHRTDYNLYEGWDLIGFPSKVFLRGHCLVDEGHWNGFAGIGRYIVRSAGLVL